MVNSYRFKDKEKTSFPEKLVLYFGTSEKQYEKIKEEGLKPTRFTQDDLSEIIDFFGIQSPRPNSLYLGTANFAYNQAICQSQKDDSKPVVLEVLVENKSLAPDEKSLKQSVRESYQTIGSVAHIGPINKTRIYRL